MANASRHVTHDKVVENSIVKTQSLRNLRTLQAYGRRLASALRDERALGSRANGERAGKPAKVDVRLST